MDNRLFINLKPGKTFLDRLTGKTKVRLVDINSLSFKIAQEYMIRLKKTDFADDEKLERLARTAGVSSEEFRSEFERVVM